MVNEWKIVHEISPSTLQAENAIGSILDLNAVSVIGKAGKAAAKGFQGFQVAE